jgi:mitogen-activated protein kinase kinase
MSSPAPLLRPPIPGSRNNSGTRTPRLGLAIPPSPNVRPVNGISGQQSARPAPPKLSIATPMGSSATPFEHNAFQSGHPNLQQPLTGQSASGGSESSAAHSRAGSFGPMDGKASGPTSAGSQFSGLSFASNHYGGTGLKMTIPQSTPDPASAVDSIYSERSDGVRMEREDSMSGLVSDLDALTIERGRTLDVEELDDNSWLVASSEKRIEELSSLGEGAGGAVTKCKLKGGKTIFALKVAITRI